MKTTTVTEQVIIDNLVQDIKTNRVKWKWVLNVKEGVAPSSNLMIFGHPPSVFKIQKFTGTKNISHPFLHFDFLDYVFCFS